MGIPEDVHKLGHKREYIQSLRTPDRKIALIQRVAEWKNAIHIARGNASAIQKVALMMRQLAHAWARTLLMGLMGLSNKSSTITTPDG